MHDIINRSLVIIVAKKLDPFSTEDTPRGNHPNRATALVVKYHVSVEEVLSNKLVDALSTGSLTIQAHSLTTRRPIKIYRKEPLETGPERMILFLDKDPNGWFLTEPHAWEDAGKKEEILRLLPAH